VAGRGQALPIPERAAEQPSVLGSYVCGGICLDARQVLPAPQVVEDVKELGAADRGGAAALVKGEPLLSPPPHAEDMELVVGREVVGRPISVFCLQHMEWVKGVVKEFCPIRGAQSHGHRREHDFFFFFCFWL
jgi:hypothetical protein